MKIRLHKNARTTPAVRQELRTQPASVTNNALAEKYRLTRHTVAKWRRLIEIDFTKLEKKLRDAIGPPM